MSISAGAATKFAGKGSSKSTNKLVAKPDEIEITAKSKGMPKKTTIKAQGTKKVFASNNPKIVSVIEMRKCRL